MPRIVRSPQVKLDLIEIWSYIARNSPVAADRLMDVIDERLSRLANSPGLGQTREELGTTIRSAPVGSYLLFYRPVENGIEVIRVLHGARNLRRLFRRASPDDT